MSDGWYSHNDLTLLSEAVKSAIQSTCEGSLLEVGVYQGLSANVIARQRAGRNLVLFDDMSLDGADETKWPKGEGIMHCQAAPHGWEGPICFLHQDASHAYDVVLAHLELFGPHMLPGSVVALHDYHEPQYPGVRAAWNAFSLASKFEPWGRGASVQVFMRT